MELIKLKGTGDGVKIHISPDAPISDIVQNLHSKLDEFRRFFGCGHCNIYFTGRALSKSDRLRLEAIVKAMLPESTINYGERRIVKSEQNAPEKEKAEAQAVESSREMENIREVVTTNFKSSRARFFEGVVRAGRVIESDGHLTLMGNVEKGGKIIAVGNIVVMGKLYGTAEAGMMGNENAYITAMEFAPERIKIANILLKEPVVKNKTMQMANVINNEIFIGEYLVK